MKLEEIEHAFNSPQHKPKHVKEDVDFDEPLG